MKNKFREFDAVQFLDNEETIGAYLEQAPDDTTPELLRETITNVARARAINRLAEKTGYGREIVYEALRRGSRPDKDLLLNIIDALRIESESLASDNARFETLKTSF